MCACPVFVSDPRCLSLTDHLEAIALGLGGALEELNTYQGMDKQTRMPVWSSGDDFSAHADLLDMLQVIERLRGRLKLGLWAGRTAS